MLCVTIKLETLILTFGVSVGKKHHRLWPEMRAFQAEVPSGSMWIPVPDLFMSNQCDPLEEVKKGTIEKGVNLGGPMTIHR